MHSVLSIFTRKSWSATAFTSFGSTIARGRISSLITRNPPCSAATASSNNLSSERVPSGGSNRSFSVMKINSNTGGLRRLPVVRAPSEMLQRATKDARRVLPDGEIQNVRTRARKHGAETLNKLSESLCLPLRDIVNGYNAEWRKLHPFERVVADLTARARQKKDGLTLNLILKDIDEARKMIREASKDWIAKVKNAETAKEAGESLEQGVEALKLLFEEHASDPVAGLMQIQKGLRLSPIVSLDTPAVVLVGAPNVGKSSIVRKISSGTPEVNSYPFTTRGMTMGHVKVFWSDTDTVALPVIPQGDHQPEVVTEDGLAGQYSFSQLCQVMDSPGLLHRPDEERNEMELLTLAAMQHLPTAVMFVMDLTGNAGDRCSSIPDQLKLRREVRARFPRRPWIDVVSKYDLGVVDGALEELEEIVGEKSYIKLSIKENMGVEELRAQVFRVLGEVQVVLDAIRPINSPRPLPSP